MFKAILTKKYHSIHVLVLGIFLLTTFSCQKKSQEQVSRPADSVNSDIALAEHLQKMKTARLQTPSGTPLMSILSITPQEQERGLSGVQPSQWPIDYSMLFLSLEDNYRTYWMPDTYFDLDIFFLDKDLKIVAIERKVKHHPGRENESTIARTRSYLCRHVLEMNSDSTLSLSLNVGDKISWMEPVALEQIVSSTLQAK